MALHYHECVLNQLDLEMADLVIKVETMLDTDGDPLLHALEGHPTIVKPNQSEAERLLNTARNTGRPSAITSVRTKKTNGPAPGNAHRQRVQRRKK